jgi:uncharacterized membrane protein
MSNDLAVIEQTNPFLSHILLVRGSYIFNSCKMVTRLRLSKRVLLIILTAFLWLSEYSHFELRLAVLEYIILRIHIFLGYDLQKSVQVGVVPAEHSLFK